MAVIWDEMEGLDDKCVWRKIAENDKDKISSGNKDLTFPKYSPCHNCSEEKYLQGIGCDKYSPDC